MNISLTALFCCIKGKAATQLPIKCNHTLCFLQRLRKSFTLQCEGDNCVSVNV